MRLIGIKLYGNRRKHYNPKRTIFPKQKGRKKTIDETGADSIWWDASNYYKDMYYLSDKSSDVKFEEISRCKSDIKRFLDRKHRMEENNEQPIIDNSEFVSEYHEENKECHEDLVKEEEHAIEEHEKMEIEEFHHDEQEHFAEGIHFAFIFDFY